MSICTPALLTKLLPTCLGLLEIGDITPSTAVTVYLKDITTGGTFLFQEVSSPTGRVMIDLTGYEFSDNHSYELWMTNPQEPIDNYITFLVEGDTTPAEVVQLRFAQFTDNGNSFPFTSVVLKAA